MSDAHSWAAATLKSAAGVAPDPQQWPGTLPYAHGALPGPNKMRLQELSFADPPSPTRTKGSTFKGSAFNRRATAARELLGAVEVAELTVLTARRQQQQQYQQQQYEQATAIFLRRQQQQQSPRATRVGMWDQEGVDQDTYMQAWRRRRVGTPRGKKKRPPAATPPWKKPPPPRPAASRPQPKVTVTMQQQPAKQHRLGLKCGAMHSAA